MKPTKRTFAYDKVTHALIELAPMNNTRGGPSEDCPACKALDWHDGAIMVSPDGKHAVLVAKRADLQRALGQSTAAHNGLLQ